MANKQIKKLCKPILAAVRQLNEDVMADHLWQGRFKVELLQKSILRFEDNSGYVIHFKAKFVDLKTNKTVVFYFNNYDYKNKLWVGLNNFIIEACRVWEEDPSPRDLRFAVDYTNGARDRLFKRWERKAKYLGHNRYENDLYFEKTYKNKTMAIRNLDK